MNFSSSKAIPALQPLVSVIIPTYNRETTIIRAVNSVLRQTYTSIEVIIVDDNSVDNTLLILKAYDDEPRVRVISNVRTKGGSGARNSGIDIAQGEYIAFQDSDDEWLNGKLERQVLAMLASDQAVMCYTSYIRIARDRIDYLPERGISAAGISMESLLLQNYVSTQTILVKAITLKSLAGFDEALPRYQDWDLVLRMFDLGKVIHIQEPLAIVYDTEGNLTSRLENDAFARNRVVNKWRSHKYFSNYISSYHNFRISRNSRILNNHDDAFKYALRAVIDYPFIIKYYANLLSSAARKVMRYNRLLLNRLGRE